MKHNIYLLFVLSILLFLGCKDNGLKNNAYLASNSTNKNHPGKKLMETYCYTCHNPTTEHDKRIAPPMIAIKNHYISSNTSKEDFVNSMLKWIKDPNEKDAKMFGAVRRFGVMPKQVFNEEDIKLIAEYMFDNDIEQPEWFEEHEKEMKNKQ